MLLLVALLYTAAAWSPTVMPAARAARARHVVLGFTLSSPSQAECEVLGIRDWPSQARSTAYEESCAEGAMRYVLEGSGAVTCGEDVMTRTPVGPNSLVRVTSDDTLQWSLDDGTDKLVVLTPEYQGPPLAIVAGIFAVLCVGLIAVS